MSVGERDYKQDRLKQFDYWDLSLHENQSYLGRSVIALHRGDDGVEMDPFADTTINERSELLHIVDGLKDALDILYQPTRLNYANLRNRWLKCHWHVVPRYEGPDNGFRVVNGFEFRDMNPGSNYSPYPKVDLPDEIFRQIHADMSEALAPIFDE